MRDGKLEVFPEVFGRDINASTFVGGFLIEGGIRKLFDSAGIDESRKDRLWRRFNAGDRRISPYVRAGRSQKLLQGWEFCRERPAPRRSSGNGIFMSISFRFNRRWYI
jgi:hypothetical protein